MTRARRLWRWILGGLVLAAAVTGLAAAPALAAPVDWQEVPASADGRQWWDAGSLRLNRQGRLSVLSRFQPASDEDAASGARPAAQLYVMELDCDLDLYRDTSINGLPRFRAEWLPSDGDALTSAVVKAACAAGRDLRPT